MFKILCDFQISGTLLGQIVHCGRNFINFEEVLLEKPQPAFALYVPRNEQ